MSDDFAQDCPVRGLGRYMVCKPCLRTHFGGSEKSCSHGWDLMAGKPRGGVCSRCGAQAGDLHCPDGPEMPVITRPS